MNEKELKIINQQREWILKLHTVFYEKSSAYTNLIMAAGYASYFALWSNTRDLISDDLARVSAASMLISLTIFVSWEITKMISSGLNSRGLAKIVLAPLDEFDGLVQDFTQKDELRTARLASTWPLVLFITIPTALVADSILLWALISPNF